MRRILVTLAIASGLAVGSAFTALAAGNGGQMDMTQEHAVHGAPPSKHAGHEAETSGHGDQGMPGMEGMPGMAGMPGMEGHGQPSAPEHAGHGAAPGGAAPVITIPADKRQLMGIRTVLADRVPFARTIRTVGRVELDERKLVTVTTKFEGWIEKLQANYTGMAVKKGQVLAEIYSPEVTAIQHEYLTLLKWRRSGDEGAGGELGQSLTRDNEALLEAARNRLRLLDVSEAWIRELERTGTPRRSVPVVSPASGVVVQKNVVQGMRVMPGEKLLDIADLSSVWVVADVYEFELGLIQVGQTATIRLSNVQGREYTARVEYVNPVLAAETRTAGVRFTVPNPGGILKPQMFTEVLIRADLGQRLAVPSDAIIDTGSRQIAYVETSPGHFEMREVQVGLRAEGLVEVEHGIGEGETVAAAANFLIDAETRLRGGGAAGGHQH